MKFLVLFACVAAAAAAIQPFGGMIPNFGGSSSSGPLSNFDLAAFMSMLSQMKPMDFLNFPVPAGKSDLSAKASPAEFRQILSQYPELAQLLSVYEQLNLSDAERQEVLDMLPSLGYPVAKYYDPMTGMYYPDTTTAANLNAQFQLFQYFGKHDTTTTNSPMYTPT